MIENKESSTEADGQAEKRKVNKYVHTVQKANKL